MGRFKIPIILLIILFLFPSICAAKEINYNKNNKLVSMDLRDVELSHAIRMFAKETGKNIIAGRDIYGKITISLKNVTPDEALKQILDASGCQYVVEGDLIRVIPSQRGPEFVVLPSGNVVKTFELNYSDPDSVKETLEKLIPPESKIITTKGLKTLLVESDIPTIKRIEALLKNIDTPPKQIMVEAKIIQIGNNSTAKLGANIKSTNPNNPTEIMQTVGLAGSPDDDGATGLFYNVTNDNIEALTEALQTRTGYNLLSSPRVIALNGQGAEIITGSRLGYKTKTITASGLIESVEFLDVGTKLTITPNIKSDGNIMMEIHPEISSGAIVNDLPQKDSTETTTKLIVKDGQTIIIGGLMKEETTETKKGIPILADIPFLGIPFRSTSLDTKKYEIVILISPHIVDAGMIAEMKGPAAQMEQNFYRTKKTSPADLFR